MGLRSRQTETTLADRLGEIREGSRPQYLTQLDQIPGNPPRETRSPSSSDSLNPTIARATGCLSVPPKNGLGMVGRYVNQHTA